MRRREFIIGGAAVVWPLAARAQQREKMRRVGVLMSMTADDLEASARVTALARGACSNWAGPMVAIWGLSTVGRQVMSIELLEYLIFLMIIAVCTVGYGLVIKHAYRSATSDLFAAEAMQIADVPDDLRLHRFAVAARREQSIGALRLGLHHYTP
jgi:hypothetical protein